LDALKSKKIWVYDALELRELCEQFKICSYQLCRKLLEESRIIGLNYAYLLNSALRERILQASPEAILIMDEAHNLPGMAEEQLSRKFSLIQLEKARIFLDGVLDRKIKCPEAQNISLKLKLLTDVVKKLQQTVKEISDLGLGSFVETFSEEDIKTVKRQGMFVTTEDIIDEEGNVIGQIEKKIGRDLERLLDLFLLIRHFKESNAFGLFFEPDQNPRVTFRCFEPRLLLKEIFAGFRIVAMSGSINVALFTLQTGLTKLTEEKIREFQVVEMPSIFNPERYLTIIDPDLNMKFENRTDVNIKAISDKLIKIGSQYTWNCAFFFPSFELLRKFDSILRTRLPGKLIYSELDVKSEKNQEMIENFKSQRNALLLGVLGGKNSEGSDFEKNCLKTVVVVGIPYASMNAIQNFRNKYYKETIPSGEFYAYIVPAFLKINQAGGRALRTEKDYAFIYLLDSRIQRLKHLLSKWMLNRICIEKVEKILCQNPLEHALLKAEKEREVKSEPVKEFKTVKPEIKIPKSRSTLDLFCKK
jgi:DNA excision repair protein ERCC-2